MIHTLQKGFYLALLLLFATVIIPCVSFGDSLTGQGNSQTNTVSDLPPADLAGWFNNGDSEFLFPTTVDPSLPWTSAANLATITAWNDLLVAAQGDPALLAQLAGLGMNTMPVSQLSSLQLAVSGQTSVTGAAGTNTNAIATPEPLLLGRLGAGGAILVLIALARRRHTWANHAGLTTQG